MMPSLLGRLVALAAVISAWLGVANPQKPPAHDFEAMPFAPRHYVCYRTPSPPSFDGNLDEASWRGAPWTELFVDIEGESRPAPRFRTRAKMLWDDTCLYLAFDIEEPDIWGTLTERDAVIYNDNDIELFVDPDGDTHAYYEIEVNPLGTIFDLMLLQPYRDGGPPIIAWDATGLRMAIAIRGTLNHPGDRDEGWTVEMGIPWRILREAAPGKRLPRPGDQWRLNFSRVEWPFETKNGKYARRTDPATGKPTPSDNWVWSPQGAIDMHMPERWGYVQFSAIAAGVGTEPFVPDPNERVKWALRRLYYRQRLFKAAQGHFSPDLSTLNVNNIQVEGIEFQPTMQVCGDAYQISGKGFGGATLWIRQDGKTWLTR